MVSSSAVLGKLVVWSEVNTQSRPMCKTFDLTYSGCGKVSFLQCVSVSIGTSCW